jgi:hypothetical protein
MKARNENRKSTLSSYNKGNWLSVIAGLVMAGVFITSMVIPAISATSVAIDKVNHMNKLTSNTIDFAFELDD